MPFVSKAQQGWFNSHRAELEKMGVDVDEWNKATKEQDKKLPEKVKPKK